MGTTKIAKGVLLALCLCGLVLAVVHGAHWLIYEEQANIPNMVGIPVGAIIGYCAYRATR